MHSIPHNHTLPTRADNNKKMACRPLLPEVMYKVAEFFTPAEATTPRLVCRVWNTFFATALWRYCSVHRSGRLPLEDLCRNEHHVRELLHSNLNFRSDYLLIPFTCLTRLALSGTTNESNRDAIARSVAELVAGNSNLQELVLDDPHLSMSRETWRSISLKRASLRRLSVSGLALTSSQFADFWHSCCLGVQHLRLNGFEPLAGSGDDDNQEKKFLGRTGGGSTTAELRHGTKCDGPSAKTVPWPPQARLHPSRGSKARADQDHCIGPKRTFDAAEEPWIQLCW